MQFIWNGLLSKAAVLQAMHSTKDLRFYGITIGWLGIGFIVGIKKEKDQSCPDCHRGIIYDAEFDMHFSCSTCHGTGKANK